MRVGRQGGLAGGRGASSVQERGLDCRLGAGHGEERTRNMWLMSVTLEVSQLDMSSLKFVEPSKRERMSVIFETSHSAIGPYFAVAAVGFAL